MSESRALGALPPDPDNRPASAAEGRTLQSVQHPGEEEGSAFERPSTRWSDFREGCPPRPSVVAITRLDHDPIGG